MTGSYTVDGLDVRRPRPADPGRSGGPAGGPPVVLVHGSLDRADSFRRVVRRLADLDVVTYDRRGYHRSRAAGPAGLDVHVEDLCALASWAEGGPVVAVGHSFGGVVVLAAADRRPDLFSAVAAYEVPLPWFGFRRPGSSRRPGPPQPEAEVEGFVRRMMGDGAWERLSPGARAERLADGPALVGDLAALYRAPAPFRPAGIERPAVFGRGGESSAPHHRAGTAWLVGQVAGARLVDLGGAGHGAHLSHPDAFAAFTRAAWDLGRAPVGASR